MRIFQLDTGRRQIAGASLVAFTLLFITAAACGQSDDTEPTRENAARRTPTRTATPSVTSVIAATNTTIPAHTATAINTATTTLIADERGWGNLSDLTEEDWEREDFGTPRQIPPELLGLPVDATDEEALALWREYIDDGAVVWGGIIGVNPRHLLCADGSVATPPGSDVGQEEPPPDSWDMRLGQDGPRHIYISTKSGFTRLPLVDAHIEGDRLMAVNGDNTWYQEVVINTSPDWVALCQSDN